MIVTLYLDMPSEADVAEEVLDFATAFARPAFATADGWTRRRIDLDTSTNEAKVRLADVDERAAFEPKRIG